MTTPNPARFRPATLSLAQLLLLSCSFSLLLVVIRVVVTGSLAYLFLLWNLFLALVPFLISRWLSMNLSYIEHRLKLVMMTLAWLLFVPNSFYLLTDIFHLEQIAGAPKWFDLLLVFSFAWNGLLLGVLSVHRMEMILQLAGGRRISFPVIACVMWLNAFGIYIGRYLRFNSWDVLTQPFALFDELFYLLVHPLRNGMQWGMITVYGAFMLLLYLTLKKMGEQFYRPIN